MSDGVVPRGRGRFGILDKNMVEGLRVASDKAASQIGTKVNSILRDRNEWHKRVTKSIEGKDILTKSSTQAVAESTLERSLWRMTHEMLPTAQGQSVIEIITTSSR